MDAVHLVLDQMDIFRMRPKKGKGEAQIISKLTEDVYQCLVM